jgi:hypothetical protein
MPSARRTSRREEEKRSKTRGQLENAEGRGVRNLSSFALHGGVLRSPNLWPKEEVDVMVREKKMGKSGGDLPS